MSKVITKNFLKWIMVALAIAIFGCGDQSRKDADIYQEGVAAYSQGNFSVAFEKFKTVAEHGHVQAEYYVGIMYLKGQGISKNEKEAGVWLGKAAERGHVEAQENMGLIYAKGLGVERNWVQAAKWFSVAAASGKETAANNKKVIEIHMPPDKVAEGNLLAQQWLEEHRK